MTLTGFVVQIETKPILSDYHCCNVIAMSTDTRSLSIWASYLPFRCVWLIVCIFLSLFIFVKSFIRLTRTTVLNYFKTTRNILFIDVSASRRKPSSGLTSGAGRQYVKACPIRGSVGSSPHLDSCSPSS